jgi:23S rRNA (cytidine2498-2'-O)-methyltransferase
MENPALSTEGLLAYCRPGFEPDLAAELSHHAGLHGIPAYAKTERGSAYVLMLGAPRETISEAISYAQLIFARQKYALIDELKDLDPQDRITPVLEALGGKGRYGDLSAETPDSDDARQLAGLAKAFANALRPALRKRGLLTDKPNPKLPTLHVVFVRNNHLLLASSTEADRAPWPMGIPRLKQDSRAPSRSAMKLDEALLCLLTPAERMNLIAEGMTAADLGAAPGGWSWVLSKHGIRVSAIDNGPISADALATGLIEHIRADGFHWQPAKTVDWMVCDMVETPSKVARRMAQWFANGWCRNAIFNLKLPMKKRWEETALCLDLFEAQCGKPMLIKAKQLYHDREEITVFARSQR